MRKALRVLAMSLTGAVLLALVAGSSAFWYMTRSLPMTQGNLQVLGLKEPVKVYRDSWGVPHVYAQNDHDLFMAQGFVTAQDRLFQMDLSRRLASGRLSEVLGSTQIDSDRFFRTIGLRRAAEASLPLYSGPALAAGEAYAEGVSTYIKQATEDHLLPWEFAVLGYKPEPWTFTDSLTVAKYMAYDMSGHWAGELFRYQALDKIGQKRAAELFPAYPAGAATILGSAPASGASLDDREMERLLAFAPEDHLGSNSWVVSGNRTNTGKPFLANDPHLSLQTPAVWYEIHLVAPGAYNVTGATFPGVPGVVLGHNQRIAWGAANLGADVQDLYVEQPNPSDAQKFLFKNSWDEAKHLQETISIRGQTPDTLDVLITRHGPIISPLVPMQILSPKTVFSLRWTGLDPDTDLAVILALDRAANWDEFRDALSHLDSPAQSFLYADVVGNIGYRAAGKIPVRKASNALLPLPGWTGEDEWQGFIPFADLPETYNPKAGYIAAANNKVTSDSYPYHITDEWAAPWRATRLESQLRDGRLLSLHQTAALQGDLTDLEAQRYTAVLLDACRQATGGKWSDLEADARMVLGEWDYVASPDSPGALVWNEWRLELMRTVFEPAMGVPLFQRFLETGSPDVALDNLLENYLKGNPSEWYDTGKDSMRSLPRLAEDSFHRVTEALAAKQGSDVDAWRWAGVHQVSFTHPLEGRPLLQRLLNRGPYPAGGDMATVAAANYRLTAPFGVSSTASWRQIVDLADLSRSLDILAPGESGHILSPFYLNQASTWLAGDYHSQVFSEAALKESDLLNLLPHLS